MNEQCEFSAPRIFDGENWHVDSRLVTVNGRIESIEPGAHVQQSTGKRCTNGMLVPGFVDIQVNGGGGVLLNEQTDLAAIRTICSAHARFGSTSVLPTLITDTPRVRDAAIAAAIDAQKQRVPGFAGLHLEGPHLSIARKGAHDPSLIRPMQEDDVQVLIRAAHALDRLIVTVASENVSPEQVATLTAAGIRISIGHSDAPLQDVRALLDAGASLFTHLFNAMSPLTSRAPGMVGAALGSSTAAASIIADGFHVHPETIRIAMAAKTDPAQLFLISDAMSCVGTDVHSFVLNGRTITRTNGKLTLSDGTLAGADLELSSALRYIVNVVGAPLERGLKMVTSYPARAAGLEGRGVLKPGARADFVWLDDALNVQQVWIGGNALCLPASDGAGGTQAARAGNG